MDENQRELDEEAARQSEESATTTIEALIQEAINRTLNNDTPDTYTPPAA